ncbi:MAG: hypothetical protein ACJAZ2_001514 [Glaciecola sp.]|jgi:hypothetical protein
MSVEGFTLKGTLEAPKRHTSVPQKAKWLSGEGAGSWFHIEKKANGFYISRYAPSGEIECEGTFKTTFNFKVNEKYEITYLSHCAQVNVIQNNDKIKFILVIKQE